VQVVFSIQFNRQIDDDELSKIRKAVLIFKNKDELPAITELQGYAFMGSGNPVPIPNGFMLFRTGADGTVENELKVERNSITYRTLHYSRWLNVWSEAEKYFEKIVPLFSINNKINGISLNYIDKFIWSGAIEKCHPSFLLNSHSKYLCPHIFGLEDLWHSHTGAFIRVDKKTKRLLNVNIDSLDEKNDGDNLSRAIVITTVFTDFFNQPSFEPYDENSILEIEKKLQDLHVIGKDVLKDILNYETSKQIALID
jgi:uncharacterized protein (TIGR04255 family)